MLSDNYSKIPRLILESLTRYSEKHTPTGAFLQAVLCNDLTNAFARADDSSRAALCEIVSYCYWELPGDCCGSEDKVKNWLPDGSFE